MLVPVVLAVKNIMTTEKVIFVDLFPKVDCTKLLGLLINSNLTWNDHIIEVIRKASKRMYFLIQLRRARVPSHDLVLFYKSCVRSVIDYSIPAFYNVLPQYLKNELVRIEKRAITALELGLTPILEHYDNLCLRLFQDTVANPNHKLHALLPPARESHYKARNKRHFSVPHLKTNRTRNTFIFAMATKFEA